MSLTLAVGTRPPAVPSMGRMLLSALPPEELDRMFCLSRDGTLQTLMSGPLTTELVAFPVWTDRKSEEFLFGTFTKVKKSRSECPDSCID